jgi:hypothetical protein
MPGTSPCSTKNSSGPSALLLTSIALLRVRKRITMDFNKWRQELLLTGNIVQDGDDSVPPDEADERCHRYVELLDAITGKEPQEVFQAIVDSIQAPDDHEVYETTHNALWRFPPKEFAKYFVAALPGLIARMAQYDQVGRFLCPLVGWGRKAYLPAFNKELGKAPPDAQRAIMNFIEENREEWFAGGDLIHPA